MIDSYRITMLHGSGGQATKELIDQVFSTAFYGEERIIFEDAAVLSGSEHIAVTTDSFVVRPLFYPGGDIGKLAVCGSVNDLVARGAVPKYLTCGFIVEEGMPVSELIKITESMAKCAKEAKVTIVAGDTKVVDGDGGLYINTAGIGFVPPKVDISAKNAKENDVIIVTGNIGDHHAAIQASRMKIDTPIISDNAPLVEIAKVIREMKVHTARDVTRGGLATVLCELAESSEKEFYIDEENIPVSDAVCDYCGIMGLDPLYMGCEGRMVCIVEKESAEEVLKALQKCSYGKDARIIGEVKENSGVGGVFLRTRIGGTRKLGELQDEGLPRIC